MPPHIIGATGNAGIPYRALIKAIREEGDAVSQRIAAISQFQLSEGFQALDVLDRHLITLQRETMQTYLHTLTIRMARFDEAQRGVLPKGASALAKKPLIQ